MINEPGRIALLPHDKHARPVPWFVAWFRDGQEAKPGSPGAVPDFRVIRPGAPQLAWGTRVCWICGCAFIRQEPRAFVIGPMCAVNRISAEPPGHYDCAVYSAQACPFLVTPNMTRRERHKPEGVIDPPGVFLRRNPGVALVWVTKYNSPSVMSERGGILFDIGRPMFAEWFCQGRHATRAEVLASLESGMPSLAESCRGDTRQLAMLDAARSTALTLVPAS